MDENEKSRQDKMRRIAVGATVGGVLLIVFLVVVLIIQFVQMGVKSSEEAELRGNIEKYEQAIEADSKELDDYKYGSRAYYDALMRGWKSKN